MKPTFQAISSLWAYCQILQARWTRSTTSQTKMKLSTTASKTPWMSTSKASLEAPGRSNTCVHLCFPTLETSSSCECETLQLEIARNNSDESLIPYFCVTPSLWMHRLFASITSQLLKITFRYKYQSHTHIVMDGTNIIFHYMLVITSIHPHT